MTELPHSAAPRLASGAFSWCGSMVHKMRPTSPDRRVDLVEHAPLIDDIEEAVFGERRRLEIFVRGRAAERDRISELEVLDVVLVDGVERRIALRVIGAVVHQPVLRLLVGIDQPIGRDVAGQCRRAREHGAGQQQRTDGRGSAIDHSFLLGFGFRKTSGDSGYGDETARLYQCRASTLTTRSLPSNSFAMRPPDALNSNVLTRSSPARWRCA